MKFEGQRARGCHQLPGLQLFIAPHWLLVHRRLHSTHSDSAGTRLDSSRRGVGPALPCDRCESSPMHRGPGTSGEFRQGQGQWDVHWGVFGVLKMVRRRVPHWKFCLYGVRALLARRDIRSLVHLEFCSRGLRAFGRK